MEPSSNFLGAQNQKIDIRAHDDLAFRNACCNNYLETAQWLSTLCPNYILKVENDKIIEWEIKDNEKEIVKLLRNSKYEEAISKIKEIQAKDNQYKLEKKNKEAAVIIELVKNDKYDEAITKLESINELIN